MKRTRLVLVLAGILALVAGGTALAAGRHSHGHPKAAAGLLGGHHGELRKGLVAAAEYLDTTPQALRSQLRSGKTLAQVADATSGKSAAGLVAALVTRIKADLAAAVQAGRLTQAQSDAIASTLQTRLTRLVNGVRPAFRLRPRNAGPLGAVATYLGISPQSLVTQLGSGKTLAQIANATSGKSASGLIDALVADVTTRLGRAAPPDLRARITALVNGTLRPWGPGRHDLPAPPPGPTT